MPPLHQLRMYRTIAAQTDTRRHAQPHTLLSSLTSLWPVTRRPGARGYSWKKDDGSPLPPFRSRTAYYDILQVTPAATQAQIKTAYYKQSFLFHPDKNAGSEEATRRFAQISEAYSVLGSKWLRRKYDSGILSQSDLQGGGRASSREPTAPPRPSSHQQRQQQHRHGNASWAGQQHQRQWGSRLHFDFDAFYRAHYGEQLQREREAKRREEVMRQRQEELRKFRQKRRTAEVTMTILLTAATLILLGLKES